MISVWYDIFNCISVWVGGYIFILSIIYLIYQIGLFSIAAYGKFVLNSDEITFKIGSAELKILWFSIAYFLTYIIF